ncbi:Hsp70 family protein [Pseudonocardia lacus]|uniref:Hsp70 family protein n=1 Tax=Pseudonocardia lacus TaxID=2835865 RepID=UPI001BDCEFAC|nr:Hsp70 family protein [Pseudonocardia lacus]
MTQTAYRVGIDLGTTYSAAAVCREGDPRPEIVPLGGLTPSVASMVFLAPDGSMVCGDPAQRRAVTDPRRVVREFKRRIGDGTPLVVGGHPVPAETVAARFVAWTLATVADREGGPADRVALTHPAEWGPHKREALAGALAAHGVTDVLFLTEPEAAAIGYASTARVDVGGTVAVYDLGGGTFDAAVVRKLADGRWESVGQPTGIEHLGGVDFDQVVFDHVREAVGQAWDGLDPADPAVQSAVAGLRRECTAAKEALSADTEVMVPVMLPGTHLQVRIGRAEFEEAIRPAVVETVEALRRALDSAGVPDPDAVLLVGGSSRIPLVSQLVSAELGRAVAIDADPKTVIATGAALAARGPVAAADDATVVVPLLDAEPPAPPLAAEPPPSEQHPDEERPAPRRGPILAIAAAAVVAATFAVGAVTLSTAEEPVAAAGTIAAPADPTTGQATVEGGQVDPWTGEVATDTSAPGPRRPRAVAAAAKPGSRIIGTGAAGASAAGGASRTVDVNPPPGVPAPNPPVGPPSPQPVDPPPLPVDPPSPPVDPPSPPVDPPSPEPVDPPPSPVDPPSPEPVDPPPPVDPPSPEDPPSPPVDPPSEPADPPSQPADPPSAQPDPPSDGVTTSAAPAPDPSTSVPDDGAAPTTT